MLNYIQFPLHLFHIPNYLSTIHTVAGLELYTI